MKNIILTYGSIGLVLFGTWFLLIYSPYHQDLHVARGEIAEAKQQLDDFKKIREELPAILAASRRLGTERTSIDCQLYAKNDILNLFDHIQKKAEERNLKITEIKPSIQELLQLNTMMPTPENPMFITIELHFEGSYLDFGRYVTKLEKAPYFRGITRCQIKKVDDENIPLQMTLGFRALLGSIGNNS